MKTTARVCAAAALLFLLARDEAHADRRGFTHTYEYMTQPQGDLELEYYNTQSTAELDTDSPTAFEQKIEIEYGLTDHWDLSLYQTFKGGESDAGSSFGYDSTALRSRYRFAERGEWPVDLLLYGELIKPFGVQGVGVEAKVIVARDFGKFTLALNLIAELEPEEELDGTEVEVAYEFAPEYALGLTYEVAPELKLGVESWGNLKTLGDEEEGALYVGPALGWAPSHKLWTAITAGFRVYGSEAKAAADVRFIVGIGL